MHVFLLSLFIISGKKSFGKAAADVLNIAVDFAESISSLSGGGVRTSCG